MRCVDVNVLVYAHRADTPRHGDYRGWLEDAASGDEPLGLSSIVLSGFLRVVTHPAVFRDPTPLDVALAFAEELRVATSVLQVEPGERHWEIFAQLCRLADTRGKVVPDAHLAALAIEAGATLYSADRGFARFPTLRWRHPLEDTGRS